MNPIPERLRTSVWTELYNTERSSRYYEVLLKKHKRADLVLRIATVILASLVALLVLLETLIIYTLGATVMFLFLYVIEILIARVKVSTLTQARKGCVMVNSLLEDLWEDIESLSVDENTVKSRLLQIRKITDLAITSQVVNAKLTENRELNIQCAKEASKNLIQCYEGVSA